MISMYVKNKTNKTQLYNRLAKVELERGGAEVRIVRFLMAPKYEDTYK